MLVPEQRNRLEAAAKWWADLTRDPSLAQSASYATWSADPRNLGALRALHDAWTAAGAIDGTPAGLELRRQAVQRVAQARVGRWRILRRVPLAAAVLLGIALAGAAVYQHVRGPAPVYYQTAIGERREVVLADGSRIDMDSATRVHVRYGPHGRAVTLDGGRSRFDVAHDPARPFTVTAGSETVVAVGTSFNVEVLPSSVLVTLIEGRVMISHEEEAARSAARPVALQAGEQLVAARNVAPAIRPADLQADMAWESGHLVFRDEPLDRVVARINRYAAHPIEIDPALASRRISGVFNAGDVPSFVSAVTSYLRLQSVPSAAGGILLQPAL